MLTSVKRTILSTTVDSHPAWTGSGGGAGSAPPPAPAPALRYLS
jgi:hypothetical protein